MLSEPGLVLDRWLSLDGALPESQILLWATLKVQFAAYFFYAAVCMHVSNVLIVIHSILNDLCFCSLKIFPCVEEMLQCSKYCTSRHTVIQSALGPTLDVQYFIQIII